MFASALCMCCIKGRELPGTAQKLPKRQSSHAHDNGCQTLQPPDDCLSKHLAKAKRFTKEPFLMGLFNIVNHVKTGKHANFHIPAPQSDMAGDVIPHWRQ